LVVISKLLLQLQSLKLGFAVKQNFLVDKRSLVASA